MVLDFEPTALVEILEGSVRLEKPPLEDWVLFKVDLDWTGLVLVLVERLVLDKPL